MRLLLGLATRILPLAAITADAASMAVDHWSPLINLGAVGCMLLWFMLRQEPRLKAVEASIERQSRAMLLLTVATPGVHPATKNAAQDLIREIDQSK